MSTIVQWPVSLTSSQLVSAYLWSSEGHGVREFVKVGEVLEASALNQGRRSGCEAGWVGPSRGGVGVTRGQLPGSARSSKTTGPPCASLLLAPGLAWHKCLLNEDTHQIVGFQRSPGNFQRSGSACCVPPRLLPDPNRGLTGYGASRG